MNLPDCKATTLTEQICARIRKKIPDLPTSIYNPVYSSIWEVLSNEFPDKKQNEVSGLLNRRSLPQPELSKKEEEAILKMLKL